MIWRMELAIDCCLDLNRAYSAGWSAWFGTIFGLFSDFILTAF
jgi:hypothetical protein